MVKASRYYGKKYLYPCHLPYLPHCKIRIRFPTISYFQRGVSHRMVHFPTHCPHLHRTNWKGTSFTPHLRYLCNLSNDRGIQNHTVILPYCLGKFLSIENGKEEIPEKEFTRSFQVAWLLIRRCFQQDLHCNAMTLLYNHYLCVSFKPMITSNKKDSFCSFFQL